jgi:hypothetical protein
MNAEGDMVDPVTSLAISMQTKKGTFALLLGSGVSRSAQIPTGWDIILDLIGRLAAAENKTSGDDPVQWFRDEYGEEPSYGDLLNRLAKTSAERSQIIRPYIEPTADERERGLKQPTDAHRAIASLVAAGYVRVIVTTNFDRLLESALIDVGINAEVIASADDAKGTLPLAHNACTVLKVHGDYVDARIKNTPVELETYDGEIDTLLDQVFREYGLVICGWSGEWDTALRAALLRSTSPWFSTYWTFHRHPRPDAREIIECRNVQVVTDMDADTFFQRLADSVQSVEDLRSPELLSVAIAEASLKRYIDDPTKRIRVHDLVTGEANRVRRTVEEATPGFYGVEITQEEVTNRLAAYERSTDVLRALFTTGCYWGKHEHDNVWVSALERLASFSRVQEEHYPDWTELRHYPALLALYAGGVAAVSSERYGTLGALLYRSTKVDDRTGKRMPLIFFVHTWIMTEFVADKLAPGIIKGAVLPDWIRNQRTLWDPLHAYIPAKDQFHRCFNLFEYFFGLVHTDLAIQHQWQAWGPTGLLPYQDHGTAAHEVMELVGAQLEASQHEWPPLRAGMFGGSLDRLRAAKQEFDEHLEGRRF